MTSLVLPTPADFDTVMTNLVTFATTNAGFVDETVADPATIDFNRNGEDPTTGTAGKVWRLSKNGVYFHFGYSDLRQLNSTNGNCELFGCLMATTLQTAMNGSNNLGTTTQGRYTTVPLFTLSGPYENAYYYSQGQSVAMVLEVTPNVFLHVLFGTLDKFGSFTGGEFISVSDVTAYSASTGWDNDQGDFSPPFPESTTTLASCADYIYLPTSNPNRADDRDDFSPIASSQSINLGTRQRAYGSMMGYSNELDNTLDNPDTNTFSSTTKQRVVGAMPFCSARNTNVSSTPSFPLIVRARNVDNEDDFILGDVTDDRYPFELLGTVNGVRIINIYKLNPKDLIETNWRVFPIFQKSGSAFSAPITGELGFLYLED